ncbi:MAG: hypothetical protein KKE02_08215 [Alphaproteobacteria bacterium]|nr:hypothetical protein [Alphaproteobacteria bacterium]MBU1514299.1 hypothetical protein [Alphaproteobacteria bacterium]MBU2095943.1 hypothetical protein [Alphaproteobacteria bacterium]MBU2150988.1 hypothetical protein [Alphaproteobacteria bacterium]MBU2308498.1 hypothetical protein [Alphaproteobacteria bacterium]
MKSMLLGALGLALAGSAAMAQPAPRTADGHPDLTGTWSNASLTWLERPASLKGLTLTDAQAKALADANPNKKAAEADAKPIDPNAGPPPEGAVGPAHSMVFMDGGSAYAKVKGQYRTSWIVDTPDGRLPLTDLGRKRTREAAARSQRMDPVGPEELAPNDRCLIGSRGSGGPGMLNNVYNSNYQIVQSPDALVVVVEMGFGTRAIPIFPSKAVAQGSHRPAALQLWMGDSVAWWDGDALVVETINVNPEQGQFGPIFLSPQARVTERFTRASPGQIAYEFQVEDPVHYTQTWRAEMSLYALAGQIYEYACHEGNYAMTGILGGARAKEAASAGAPKTGGQR